MKGLILSFLGFSLICSGCASIMCSPEKTVNITSEPPGAEFEITKPDGRSIVQGITPMNVTLKRGRGWFKAGDYTIRFVKSGYELHEVLIEQKLETGWYVGGNLVLGGLIGWLIVDPLTGAMYNINDVHVTLRKAPSS